MLSRRSYIHEYPTPALSGHLLQNRHDISKVGFEPVPHPSSETTVLSAYRPSSTLL